MTIINMLFRKNRKPLAEVMKDAPSIDPANFQKYTVGIESDLFGAKWSVSIGDYRLGVSTSPSIKAARFDAEQFIIDHETCGKIVYFNNITYDVTVNRFNE